MELNNESKTLFIPLYGKALMSKENLFIYDSKAEEIINNIEFNFDNLKQSKWLSMYMTVRSLVIDEICNKYIKDNSNCTIIHLGCGLDSRALRIDQNYNMWYDIDFENVINLRKSFYNENSKYKMIGKSVTDLSWLNDMDINSENTLIVAEGLTMYLSEEELQNVISAINDKLSSVTLVFDAYSKKAVKVSKYKNPVNQMNAIIKWGMNEPNDFSKLNNNLEFVKEYLIKYEEKKLKGLTKFVFENLYCGKISERYYKVYEFKLKKK